MLFDIAVTDAIFIFILLFLNIFCFLRKTYVGGISIVSALWFTRAKEIRWRSLVILWLHLHGLELIKWTRLKVIRIQEVLNLPWTLLFIITLAYKSSGRFPQIYSIKLCTMEVRISLFQTWHYRIVSLRVSKLVFILLYFIIEWLDCSVVTLFQRCLQILVLTSRKPLVTVFFA